MQPKAGVIDVGGGMRGVYAAGVFDRCLEDGVHFDAAMGISAGSANIVSFLAGQQGRNLRFYTQYSFRKQYMGWGNFLRKRSFIDLDYVYSTLSDSDGEDPLDYDMLAADPTELIIVGCHARTGQTRYFTRADIERDRYDILKASSALPVVCRPYEVDGELYYDGALGDTIPVQKALDLGCERLVLVLTKPRDTVRSSKGDRRMARLLRLRHPQAAARLAGRAQRYNDGVAHAKRLESEGRALVLAPDDTCGVDTLAKDRDAMLRLYRKGYDDGAAIAPFLAQSA